MHLLPHILQRRPPVFSQSLFACQAIACVVRPYKAFALALGKIVPQTFLRIVSPVMDIGGAIHHNTGHRLPAIRGLLDAGKEGGAGRGASTAAIYVVVDGEKAMSYQPFVDEHYFRLSNKIILAEIRVLVQPVFHIWKRELRHFEIIKPSPSQHGYSFHNPATRL